MHLHANIEHSHFRYRKGGKIKSVKAASLLVTLEKPTINKV